MLMEFCKLRGGIPPKLLKQGKYSSQHFDDEGRIAEMSYDEKTGKANLIRYIRIPRRPGELSRVLLESRSLSSSNIPKMLESFIGKIR